MAEANAPCRLRSDSWAGRHFQSNRYPAAPRTGPWLQDIQLLLRTPQKLPNCSKPQPGPKSRTATFLWRCAHNPACWPAPGRLHRLSAAPKQCQNITWELSLFNSKTSGQKSTAVWGSFFPPREKMTGWNSRNGQGIIPSTTPEQPTTRMHFKAHHYREKGTSPPTLKAYFSNVLPQFS